MMTDVPKTVDAWAAESATSRLSGEATVITEINGDRQTAKTEINPGVISEFRTKIPADMFGHIKEILRERDDMVAKILASSMELPNEELQKMHLTSLKATCLQIAIDLIRNKYAKREHNGEASEGNGSNERGSECIADAGGSEAQGEASERGEG